MSNITIAQNNFQEKQLQFKRVQEAYQDNWTRLRKDLTNEKYAGAYELFIAAYKDEGKLELWCKNTADKRYRLFKTYNFCAHSGTLGPKVKEGDLQTPEGFYKINVFNPESTYHLSLGIDYPNKVDLERTGKNASPGGDIYIHGKCVTVGCIPLTDEKIKEVYLIALFAKAGKNQEIPVFIFPFQMTNRNLKKHAEKFPEHLAFWQNLQPVYQHFIQNKSLPKITYEQGRYMLKEG